MVKTHGMRRLGYHVLEAKDGHHAIEIYEANADRIDLVILDVIMPGLSGAETFDELKRINPNVKVLLSSGYSMDGQAKRIMARGCDGFIQKPFNLQVLSDKLGELT
jgi:CheY-like chemotaxis protein